VKLVDLEITHLEITSNEVGLRVQLGETLFSRVNLPKNI
jgi:hypothetical protein